MRALDLADMVPEPAVDGIRRLRFRRRWRGVSKALQLYDRGVPSKVIAHEIGRPVSVVYQFIDQYRNQGK